jgi:DNA-binding CsgD family transcriptional regulator
MKRQLDDQLGVALCLEALAWIAATQQGGERSAMLLGAADVNWRAMGFSVAKLPFFTTYRSQGEAAARQLLSERAFQTAVRRGAELSTEQAITLALEEVVPATPADEQADRTGLTRREQQIAELFGMGLSNRQIADRLVISQRTAEGHVEHILGKLGFTSRTQVAAWVAEHDAERRAQRRHLRPVSGAG